MKLFKNVLVKTIRGIKAFCTCLGMLCILFIFISYDTNTGNWTPKQILIDISNSLHSSYIFGFLFMILTFSFIIYCGYELDKAWCEIFNKKEN